MEGRSGWSGMGGRLATGVRRSGNGIVALLAVALLTVTIGASGCSAQIGGTSTTTPAPAKSTTTAPAAAAKSVTVQGLMVMEPPGKDPVGNIFDCTVSVAPNPGHKVAVGVIEGEVFGTGSQWRAASWAAPLAAVNLLNLDIADYKFSYEVSGSIDGPSAGALMTVATLAALLGDTVRPDATMTGAINPDYTVGPVGGIPYKIEGAAKAGKKLALIPLGQRMDLRSGSGQFEDVVSEGQKLGIEVREVGDIYEAYEALTGKPLPQAQATTVEPQLSEAARAQIVAQSRVWIDNTQKHLDEYAGLPDKSKSDYEDGLVSDARAASDAAAKYLVQDVMGSAYFSAMSAALSATMALNSAQLEGDVQARGDEVAAQSLAAASLTPELQTLMAELSAVAPANSAEAVALLKAWGYWVAADGYSTHMDSLLANLPTGTENAEQRLGDIYRAIWNFSKASIAMTAARDSLALGATLEGPPLAKNPPVRELAEAYRRAALANVENLQVLVVPQIATDRGVSADQASWDLSQEDYNFAEAVTAVNHIADMMDKMPEGTARDYAVLGASLMGFADSAASLGQHYAYRAETDASGTITGFAYDRALTKGLDFARSRAQLMISIADKGRSIAALPTLYYQSAGTLREGSPQDKLDALNDYWTASLLAGTMASLSGELKPLTH